jgi:hypothetical protein
VPVTSPGNEEEGYQYCRFVTCVDDVTSQPSVIVIMIHDTADEEFNCYRMLHAIYRGNSLELVGILKELCKTWDNETVRTFILL